MLLLIQANILTVGLEGKAEAFEYLPIELIETQTAFSAARSLKSKKIDSVISMWDLVDMTGGEFIHRLRRVKPEIPTIVLVESGNARQEIAARAAGASVVFGDDVADHILGEALESILRLKVASVKRAAV